jgi:hypothetical protein
VLGYALLELITQGELSYWVPRYSQLLQPGLAQQVAFFG